MNNLKIKPYSTKVNFTARKTQEEAVGKPYLKEQISELIENVENTIGYDNFKSQEVTMDGSKAFEKFQNTKEAKLYLGKVVLKVLPDEETKGTRILKLSCHPTRAGKQLLGEVNVINNLAYGSSIDVLKRLSNENLPDELQKLITGAVEYMSRRAR